MIKTFSAKAQDVERSWYVIDAADKIVGEVAVAAATLLRGKHKTIFTPHVDTGDNLVIINADKARFSGTKETSKIYTRYTGYVGNQKVFTPRKLREGKRPEQILELAIKGMIPKTKLGAAQFKKLHVYTGAEHQHEAQSPQVYEIA